MPEYFWDETKNSLLLQTRNIGFEDIVAAIHRKMVLADIPHPNHTRYPNQRIMVVKVRDYVYAVPYVIDNDNWFLKNIYPNRKYNKKYLNIKGVK